MKPRLHTSSSFGRILVTRPTATCTRKPHIASQSGQVRTWTPSVIASPALDPQGTAGPAALRAATRLHFLRSRAVTTVVPGGTVHPLERRNSVMPHSRPRLLLLALVAASLGFAPAAALAKEESKIQVLLLEPGSCDGNGGGGAKGQGPIADVKSFLQEPGGKAGLQLRARGLAPSTEHELLALSSEADPAPQLLASFTTGANGQFVGSFDLHKGDAVEAPLDPRGKYLVIEAAGSDTDLLAGWLYGAPEDDCPMTKVKELTRLAPD